MSGFFGRRVSNVLKFKRKATPVASKVDVHLCDDTVITLGITPKTTVLGCCVMIRTRLKLANDCDYVLFENSSGNKFVALDLDQTIANVIKMWGVNELVEPKLYYRRRIYLPDQATERAELACKSADEAPHYLAYIDARYNYLTGAFRFGRVQIATLGALLQQITEGDYDEEADGVEALTKRIAAGGPDNIVPSYAVYADDAERPTSDLSEAVSHRAMAAAIAANHQGLAGTDVFECQRQFLRLCKDFVAYGCDFYPGKRTWKNRDESGSEQKVKERTEDVLIAVGNEGLHLLSSEDPLRIESHEYEVITKWTVSRDGKIFAFSVGEDVIVYLVTDLAPAIEKTVENYVTEVVAIRSGKVKGPHSCSPDAEPSSFDMKRPPAKERRTGGAKVGDAADGAGGAGGAGAASATPAEDVTAPAASETGESDAPTLPAADAGESGAAADDGSGEAAAADGDLPENWEALEDDEGNTYYYNSVTEETSWDKPGGDAPGEESAAGEADDAGEGGGLPEGWEELQDDEGNTYYYNATTEETSWDKPEGDAGGGGEALPEGWEELQDDEGNTYYYNATTEETSWDKPT